MTDDRVVTLETRLAYLEHTIQQLDDEVATHRRRIDALESTSRDLRQRLRTIADALAPARPGDETPPHY